MIMNIAKIKQRPTFHLVKMSYFVVTVFILVLEQISVEKKNKLNTIYSVQLVNNQLN